MLALTAIAPSLTAVAEDPGRLELDYDVAARTMNWTDIDSESAYRVSGDIGYLHFPPCGRSEQAFSEHVVVDEMLPGNTTRFEFPPSQDLRADSIGSMQLKVEALDASGSVIAMNGFAFTADKFCTPEEIAAGLAAAGSGYPRSAPHRPWVALSSLAFFGGIALLGGAAMRRRAH